MNTAAVVFISGGGFALIAAILTGIFMRSVNRNNATKLLSEAQSIAQKTAIESTSTALQIVQKQCDACNMKLERVEVVCEALIDAAEALLAEDTPANRSVAGKAIWAARHAI